MKQQHDKIELRSEKVRDIIGARPPLAIRIGTMVLLVVYAAIIAFILTHPFPHGSGESIYTHLFVFQLY